MVITPPTLIQVIETIDVATPTVSPDGKLVAFRQGQASVADNRYALSWWVVPIDAATPPRKVGDGGAALWTSSGTPILEAPAWSADSTSLYYRALKDEQVQVWRSPSDRDVSDQITRDDADVERFRVDDGGRVTYVVRASRAKILEAEADAYTQGVRIDHTVDPSQNLFAAIQINGRMSSQRLSGSWFQRDGILADAPDQVKVLNAGALVTVTQVKPEAPDRPAKIDIFAPEKPIGQGSVSARGRVSARFEAGGTRLRVERPSGEVLICVAEPCVAQPLAWSAWAGDADLVVFATRDAGLGTTLYSWRPGAAEARQVAHDDGLLDGGGYGQPCAVTKVAAICVTAAAIRPPALESFDLATGRRQVLARPNGEAIIDPAVRTQPLAWRDAKGRRFTGQLLLPAQARAAPLFVHYYQCGGYLRGGVGDEFPFAEMARSGIAVLCVNETRDDSHGQDAIADYEAALDGVRAGVEILRARGLIDSTKVGMGGLSFGSEVALWVAIHSDLLAAVSIASVQIGPTYYWLNGVAGRDTHAGLRRAWGLGAPDETPERWKAISSALNINRLRAPTLMQLPEQEYRPTMDLFAPLSNSATPTELFVFAQEPHILTQPRHRLAAYTRNLDWFRFWLQGQVDPSPWKADQNRRWTAMKEKTGTIGH